MALAQKNFADLITFTRSSGGGRFNAAGQFEWLAANQPRFDYDPVTLQAKGILIEEQRTNLLTQSEFVNGVVDAPTRAGLVSATAFAGFAGGLAIGYDGSTLTYAYKSISAIGSTQYSLSVFIRMDDGLAPTLGGATSISALNDFVLNIAGSIVPSADCTISNVGGGLYRVSAKLTTPATPANTHAGVLKYGSNSPRTFKITGYHLEVGAFPTSYIPTTNAQVTRSADVPSVNTLSPWYRADEGTLFVDGSGRLGGAGGTANGALACIGTATEYSALIQQTATAINATTRVGGVNTASIAVAKSQGISAKSAFSFKQDSFSLAVNGVLGAQDTSGGLFNGIGAKLNVGNFGGAANFANGHIREIRYYPRRLSDSELQQLTA